MDSLTTLSLAGSIVEFLDFASDLLSGKFWQTEMYTSISAQSIDVLDLASTTARFQFMVNRLPPLSHLSQTTADGLDHDIQGITQQCREVAEDITRIFESLKMQERTWKAIRVVNRTLWARSKLDALKQRLSVLRMKLSTHLSDVIRRDLDVKAVQQNEWLAKLDQETKTIVQALVAGNEVQEREFQDRVVAISYLLNSRDQSGVHDEDPQIIQGPERTPRQEKHPSTEIGVREKVQKKLLRYLQFSVMDDRFQEITEAHSHTFQWIFEKNPPDDQWSSFPDWLSRGEGIYWINGKEGSGKSVLMKHIFASQTTHPLLTEWASPLKLSTAAFFFWNSGSLMESSQQGLLRSLLYTVLARERGLLAVVLPHQWALEYSSLSSPAQFGRPELESWSFITQDLIPLKLFLLVDGLDEFKGDQVEIINLFQTIASSSNVKALVSSRPLERFKEAFGACPGLCLDYLNDKDIALYVSDRLEKNKAFQIVYSQQPEEAKAIVQQIVFGSKGLFLWVDLIVRSLLRDLNNGESLAFLEKRLRVLPSHLNTMYTHMLAEIEPGCRVDASKILQIIFAGRKVKAERVGNADDPAALTLIDLALSDNDLEGTKAKIHPWSENEFQHRCKHTEKHLRNQWPGFIEIQPLPGHDVDAFSRISFSHRSAREFLSQERIQSQFLACTEGSDFNPFLCLQNSFVHHLKVCNKSQFRDVLWRLATTALTCGYHFESTADASEAYFALLTALDSTMQHHHKQLFQDANGRPREKIFLFKNMTKSDNGQEARDHAALHWSNFNPDYPKPGQPLEWDNNFLVIAVQFGLSKFLDGALRKDDEGLKKNGRPLLDYAMSPAPDIREELITAEVVKVLLEHGANPNKKYKGRTCWQNALIWQYEQSVAFSGEIVKTPSQGRELAEIRASIFSLLLKKGADANVFCKVAKGKLSVEQVFSECFKNLAPPDLERLLQLLVAQRATSHKFKMPWRLWKQTRTRGGANIV